MKGGIVVYFTYNCSIYCIGKLKIKNPGQQVSVTWSSRNPKVEFPYNKRQVHVLSRDCSLLPGTPLRRSQGKCSSSLSCCAPRVNSANMAQLSLQELTATSLLPRRGYNCIILKLFHQCLHCTLVSIRGTPAAQVCLGIGVRYSHRLQPRGEEQHNRAQAVEECRSLSARGDPGPIKCLR